MKNCNSVGGQGFLYDRTYASIPKKPGFLPKYTGFLIGQKTRFLNPCKPYAKILCNYSGSQESEVCPMPYALCPMPYARRVPHVTEKNYTKCF